METSNFGSELHVAQQSRREKLRVQNHSNLSHNVEAYSHMDHQFRYANLSYEPVAAFPTEVINFAAAASTNTQPLLSHSKDVMMFHQESISPSAKVSGDPQNCSTWKSIGSQENCDWIIANYNTSGGSATGIDGNPNPVFVGQGLSASLKSNTNHSPFMKPGCSSFGYHHQVRSSMNYNSPSLFHNPAAPQEMGFAAIPPQNNRENSSVSWPNGGNELVLLPAYADRSSTLPSHSGCDRWNGDLVYSENKNSERDDPRISGNDGSNTQALSLSLSSVPVCKSHGCERMVPENLPTGPGCFGSLNQGMKTTKSEYLCFDAKGSYNGNGKGVESDQQHGLVGNQTAVTNRGLGPLGPFTGYATILKSSRFLRPAQLLLDEFCNMVGPKSMKILDSPQKFSNEIRANCDDVNATESIVGALGGDSGGSSSTFYSSNNDNEKSQEIGGFSSSSESYRPEYLQKKAKLLYMLEEVCRRYKHYNQQMQMVVSAFETVAGLSAATPYISQALKSISRHFRGLRSAISDQLKNVRNALGEDLSPPTTGTSSSSKGGDTSMTSRLKLMDHQTLQKQKAAAGGSVAFFETQPHVWRPQRGLPERAVAILRAWLFDHFLHPYPTDADKHMLATQTGLSRNQVSNWFINARVRVWKPMVEEIHMLETKGGSAETGSVLGKSDAKRNDSVVSMSNDFQTSNRLNTSSEFTEKPVECSEMGSSGFLGGSRMSVEEWNQKRSRVECQIPPTLDGSLVGFVPYQQNGIDIGSLGAVSLTLGLRRNTDGLQQQQHDSQLRRHFGDQILYDFVG